MQLAKDKTKKKAVRQGPPSDPGDDDPLDPNHFDEGFYHGDDEEGGEEESAVSASEPEPPTPVPLTRKKHANGEGNSSQSAVAAAAVEAKVRPTKGAERQKERAAKQKEAKREAKVQKFHALAAELGLGIGSGDENSSRRSGNAKSEANPSQGDVLVGNLASFSTKLQDQKVLNFTCDPYPTGNFRVYWAALCMKVSSASGNPKKAYRLMKEIESSKFEDLANDHGMDSLFQKLRYELQRTIK